VKRDVRVKTDVIDLKCAVCGNMLDKALIKAGYRTHPCCDSADQPA
jgi:hypothetical protein